jgi:hypothetical protein
LRGESSNVGLSAFVFHDWARKVLPRHDFTGMRPAPHRFVRCADYKAPNTVNRVEESNQDLLSCSVQCRTKTKLLRGYVEGKSNYDCQRTVGENCA